MDGANFEKNCAGLKTTEKKVGSKAKYEKSQNETLKLKTELEDANEDQERKPKPINRQQIFNCGACIADWGDVFREKWQENKNIEVSDSTLGSIENISTFSSLEELARHLVEAHDWSHDDFCKEKSCLQYKDHEEHDGSDPGIYIHGDLVCDTCEVTFEDECDLEYHIKLIHENIAQMCKVQVFSGYLIHICGALKYD